jgi:hypothetical protein
MMTQKERILELHRSAFETQEEADRVVAYWATRGITIKWGVPVLEGAIGSFKLPDDHPTRNCPECKKDIQLHFSNWRQQIRPDGKPGRFLMFCRKCEDKRAGFTCKECRKHKPGSLYKTTDRGRRLRICNTCRQKPLEQRRVLCTKCNKRRKGNEFRWKNEDMTLTVGACLPCERRYWKKTRKPRSKKSCTVCLTVQPNENFDLGPKGSRRQWVCKTCLAARINDKPRACTSCKEVKDAEMFSLNCYRPGERKSVCKACVSRVQAYKNRRARLRAKQSHPNVSTPVPIHPQK